MPAWLRIPLFMLISTMLCLPGAEGVAKTTQRVELDWCSIELPTSVKVGESAVYRVTITNIPAGAAKINFDLHWIDTTGTSKGMNVAGGSQFTVLNQPIEWTLKPSAKEQIGKVLPVFYLSTEGTWATKTADKMPKLPAIDVVE